MATVVLGAVGGAIGGAAIGTTIAGIAVGAVIGQAVGAVVGNYIDQAYLFPALFGRPNNDVSGPRLDDVRVQTASEGSAVVTCLGPENRTAGTVIWCTDLVEHKKTQKSGGKGMGGSSSSTTYWYSVSLAIGVCKGEIAEITKIWADSKLIYDDGDDDDRYESLSIYLGSATQTADSVIEAEEGAGNVPAFRGLAYIVVEALKLADFGNRIPQFSFLVRESETKTRASAITAICEQAGLVEAEYDTTDVSGNLQGYSYSGLQEASKLLEPLMLVYDISARESNGILYFYDRDEVETISPDDTELAVRAYDDDSVSRPFTLTDLSSYKLPHEVTVRHLDPERDYQAGLQREARVDCVGLESANFDIPLTLDADIARALAKRLLWTTWAQRLKADFTLPRRYIHIEEGDLVALTYADETYTVRAMTVERGLNYVMHIEGVVEETQTATETADADSPPVWTRVVDTLPTITLTIIDVGPLTDSDATSVGFYYAVSRQSTTPDWRGASVYDSVDDLSFSDIGSSDNEATAGVCDTTLADGPVGFWDRKNTLRVTLYDGTLESKTSIEVLRGENHAYVGDEVIGYQTATLISGTTYDLSILLRGRRATNDATDGHGAAEAFTALAAGSVQWLSSSLSYKGVTRYWKGVAVGQALADVASFSQALSMRSTQCFAPAHVTGTRDGSNNLTIDWVRVTRLPYRMFSGDVVPLIEPVEEYLVEIMDGATVLRSTTVTAAVTLSYTAAQQTADGGTPGDDVNVRIRQVSQVYGYGRTIEETI